MSDRNLPTGASRRDVLKSGALGVGTLAGLAGASAMFAPAAGAAAAPAAGTDPTSYFLKLDGVPGESTDAAHKGEIQLLSFSWGVSNAAKNSGSAGRAGAGRATFSDFNFTAITSKASPLLMLNTASGKRLKSAVVTGSRSSGDRSQEFIKIELTDVLVSSYEQSASSEAPIESASLSFAKVQFSYTSQTASGAPGTTTTAGWDIRANKPM